MSEQSRIAKLGLENGAVFAHPDDETFCAGGTLAKYAAAGAEVLVASATRGQAGQIRDSAAATRRTLGRVREQELRRAGRQLGIQHVLCLDYKDGMLDQVDPEVLVGEVVRIICAFCPDVVITFDPSSLTARPRTVSPTGSSSLGITNLTGHPAACLKAGFVDGSPLALMITGRLYDEATVLRVALAYERATKWHTMHPPTFRSSPS